MSVRIEEQKSEKTKQTLLHYFMQIINENTANVIPITDHVEKIKMYLGDEVRHYEEEYDVELPPIDNNLEKIISAIEETNTDHILYDFLSLLKYCISAEPLPSKQMDSSEQSDTQHSGTARGEYKEQVITNKEVCFNCGSDNIQYSANAWFNYNTDEYMSCSDSIGREIWCGNCCDDVDTIGQDYFYDYPEWVVSSEGSLKKFREFDDFETHICTLGLGDQLQNEILQRFEGEQKDFNDYGTFTVQVILNDQTEE